ncbi:hypothetical protein H0H93_014513 [Arthromyces matolae]|nr:hypothetical protein H0H93_014513 [Arthromyces matolae]
MPDLYLQCKPLSDIQHVGQIDSNSQKIPKGSWTHFPSRSSVGLVSTTIAHCCALLLKMRDKLLEAYSSFTLAMQSGAFLQLILAFIAIISRLRIICDTLHENLLSISTVIEQLQALIPATVIGLSHKDIDLDPLPVVPRIQTTLAVENTNPFKSVEPVDSDLVNTTSATIHSASTPARTVIKRNVPPIPEQKERKMKKRPKINDEIDDIFGF